MLPLHFDKNAGIAIGPILFIVAILAILATAIAAGSSTFSSSTNTEKVRTYAGSIIDYSTLVYNAVQRVKALGCADTQVSFENNVVTGYTNSNAPSDKHCHVFDIAGGGVVWTDPVENTSSGLPYQYDAGYMVLGVGHTYTGTDSPDLVMIAPIASVDVCNQINSLLGNPATLASDNYINNNKFTGTYTYNAGYYFPSGGNTAGYYGKTVGCLLSQAGYPHTGGNDYWFFRVLIPR